jgi:hypothetical protein
LRRQTTGGDEAPVSIVTGLAKNLVQRGKSGALDRLAHGLGMDADNLAIGIQNQGPATCFCRIIRVALLHRIRTDAAQIAVDRCLVWVAQQPLKPGRERAAAGVVLAVVAFNGTSDFITAGQ